ncbi:hypothetical protein HBB16_17150 [Pseudonocardia sp. MCCB 268]|nr:hypothetical protein [Pseudonocardia cytotoxica]
MFGGVRATRDGEPLVLAGCSCVPWWPRSSSPAGAWSARDAPTPPGTHAPPRRGPAGAAHLRRARLRGVLEPNDPPERRHRARPARHWVPLLALPPDRVDRLALRDLAACGAAARHAQRPHEALTLLTNAAAATGPHLPISRAGRSRRPRRRRWTSCAPVSGGSGCGRARHRCGRAALLGELEALTREHRCASAAGSCAPAPSTGPAGRPIAPAVPRTARPPAEELRRRSRARPAGDRAGPCFRPRPGAAALRPGCRRAGAGGRPSALRAFAGPGSRRCSGGDDLAGLAADLDAHRLVTVVGPGWVGVRPRLALAAARERAGRCGWPSFADLAVTGADLLGPRSSPRPREWSPRRHWTRWRPRSLRHRGAAGSTTASTCFDAVAGLLAVLLPVCPGLRVLATAGNRWWCPGEHLRVPRPAGLGRRGGCSWSGPVRPRPADLDRRRPRPGRRGAHGPRRAAAGRGAGGGPQPHAKSVPEIADALRPVRVARRRPGGRRRPGTAACSAPWPRRSTS